MVVRIVDYTDTMVHLVQNMGPLFGLPSIGLFLFWNEGGIMFIQRCTHVKWSEIVLGNGTLMKTGMEWYTHKMPSTLASGRPGTLLPGKAALPR